MIVTERTSETNVTPGHPPMWTGSVHHFDTIASTMDEARSLARAGAPHGTVAAARCQLAGRGRSGRGWVSPPGNLHATFVLRPGTGPAAAPQLGFVTAVAVAAAVDALAGPPTTLKWPNDVLRRGAKLAGILLERLDDGAVLAGIGLNLRHAPPGMPYAVTSLHAEGCDVTAETMLAALRAILRDECALWQASGFGPVLDRWRARGPALGAAFVVQADTAAVTGGFAGLRADGALLLDTAGGRRAFVAGDVQPCV